MYILECSDGSYYTGSTIDLEKRLNEHQTANGANHTKKRLPVTLVYFEEFQRIDDAFYREKQIQGWSRKKKEALIHGFQEKLPELSVSYRDIVPVASRASATENSRASATNEVSNRHGEIAPVASRALVNSEESNRHRDIVPVASRASATGNPRASVNNEESNKHGN